ncbi:MAG: glycyl-radical enzyme activating protein [Chloroflexota bacterium]|nr:glycyl-radical enzyme activating protein [Chloroflexota bacterium]
MGAENDRETLGVVNDIQRMSICDGPGYRTTVFLKGCYLDCQWCHNPEGKRRYPEVFPYIPNCIGCMKCVDVCPTGALTVEEENKPIIDKGLCNVCLQCVKVCKYDALVVWGKIMRAGEVMDEVEKDLPFYVNSGGGMTLSGGEPMAQPEFALALMKLAKALEIHTALDTAGNVPWEDFEKVLEYTDLVLYDIKIMDPQAHKEYSGRSNELILDNAKRIAGLGKKMRIRIPVIPGRNNTVENMRETGEFIRGLGDVVLGIDLLPYHPYAGSKYRIFGLPYPFPEGEGLADQSIDPFIDVLVDYADVTVGG